jgi:hypothetical protein
VRPLSPTARRDFNQLVAHYERLGRAEAILNLIAALTAVSERIDAGGGAGLRAPTAYPEIARLNLGLKWLKQGPYWFSFTGSPDMTIVGIFYHTSDIPNRL